MGLGNLLRRGKKQAKPAAPPVPVPQKDKPATSEPPVSLPSAATRTERTSAKPARHEKAAQKLPDHPRSERAALVTIESGRLTVTGKDKALVTSLATRLSSGEAKLSRIEEVYRSQSGVHAELTDVRGRVVVKAEKVGFLTVVCMKQKLTTGVATRVIKGPKIVEDGEHWVASGNSLLNGKAAVVKAETPKEPVSPHDTALDGIELPPDLSDGSSSPIAFGSSMADGLTASAEGSSVESLKREADKGSSAAPAPLEALDELNAGLADFGEISLDSEDSGTPLPAPAAPVKIAANAPVTDDEEVIRLEDDPLPVSKKSEPGKEVKTEEAKIVLAEDGRSISLHGPLGLIKPMAAMLIDGRSETTDDGAIKGALKTRWQTKGLTHAPDKDGVSINADRTLGHFTAFGESKDAVQAKAKRNVTSSHACVFRLGAYFVAAGDLNPDGPDVPKVQSGGEGLTITVTGQGAKVRIEGPNDAVEQAQKDLIDGNPCNNADRGKKRIVEGNLRARWKTEGVAAETDTNGISSKEDARMGTFTAWGSDEAAVRAKAGANCDPKSLRCYLLSGKYVAAGYRKKAG